MPSLRADQATLFVDVSVAARKLLKSQAQKNNQSMGDVLDSIIGDASTKSIDKLQFAVKQLKRSETLSLIISKENKVWLKKFCQKINSKMAPTVELLIMNSLS